MSPDEVRQALAEHRKWLETSGEQGKRLEMPRANLSGVDLSGARLSGADLSGADLTRADLSGADLFGGILHEWIEPGPPATNLSGAKLSGATLAGADLYQTNLAGADLTRVNLAGMALSGVDLTGAKLVGADLSRVKLSDGRLVGADLSRAKLSSADLTGADLTGAKLVGADLSGALLMKVNLSGADLTGAKLVGTQFLTTNLSGANLTLADLSGAHISAADLTAADLLLADLSGADLSYTRLENARLHEVKGLRLDFTFTRGAQFTPLGSGWRALLCNRVLPPLHRWFERRGWKWLARRTDYPAVHRDRWSVLRQTYAGPRTFILFFFVVLFALPYVARAGFYAVVGPVEQKLMDRADARKKELQREIETGPAEAHQTVRLKIPNETVTVSVEGKAVSVILPPKDIEIPLSSHDARLAAARKELAALEAMEHKAEPRSLWQVLLKWNEGWGPTILALLLIVYNVGVYVLVTSVGPLRDDEERSGWSPRWVDYRKLVVWHKVVTFLFYVSVVSFVWNVAELLPRTVWVFSGG